MANYNSSIWHFWHDHDDRNFDLPGRRSQHGWSGDSLEIPGYNWTTLCDLGVNDWVCTGREVREDANCSSAFVYEAGMEERTDDHK